MPPDPDDCALIIGVLNNGEREFHVLKHHERYASRAAQAFLERLNAAPSAKRHKRTPW